ncbi:hypothetical protein M0811_01665 [Anaeramoeba ignava]|uniref:Uncharacterized protein n=1 Tax=Anaeramoeba ignava TaxID=1746090 RepID=A0A9Q0LK57_ANAIG|nr:hypothetical protein M0811_01665 [Anaeramoeba ignava]
MEKKEKLIESIQSKDKEKIEEVFDAKTAKKIFQVIEKGKTIEILAALKSGEKEDLENFFKELELIEERKKAELLIAQIIIKICEEINEETVNKIHQNEEPNKTLFTFGAGAIGLLLGGYRGALLCSLCTYLSLNYTTKNQYENTNLRLARFMLKHFRNSLLKIESPSDKEGITKFISKNRNQFIEKLKEWASIENPEHFDDNEEEEKKKK